MMGGAGGFGGRPMGGMQPGIPKPNPYVIAETKRGDDQSTEV